jgi:GntR family transcriptional regulator
MNDTPLVEPAAAIADSENPVSVLLEQLRVDDRISEPYYLQLQRQIEGLMYSGALPVGTSMPSERDLAGVLKISRPTIKRCYDELRRAQLLLSRGRGGTRVQGVPQSLQRRVPRVAPALRYLKGFTDEMRELGRTPSTRVLERAVVSDRFVASMFNRVSGSEFLRLVRLRLADDIPMSREVAWYDLILAPELANWPGDSSAYQFLREHCGLRLVRAQQTIEAVTSSSEETEAFELAAPGPCLLLKRLSYTADDKLVEYVEGTFRGDAYRYQIDLGL